MSGPKWMTSPETLAAVREALAYIERCADHSMKDQWGLLRSYVGDEARKALRLLAAEPGEAQVYKMPNGSEIVVGPVDEKDRLRGGPNPFADIELVSHNAGSGSRVSHDEDAECLEGIACYLDGDPGDAPDTRAEANRLRSIAARLEPVETGPSGPTVRVARLAARGVVSGPKWTAGRWEAETYPDPEKRTRKIARAVLIVDGDLEAELYAEVAGRPFAESRALAEGVAARLNSHAQLMEGSDG